MRLTSLSLRQGEAGRPIKNSGTCGLCNAPGRPCFGAPAKELSVIYPIAQHDVAARQHLPCDHHSRLGSLLPLQQAVVKSPQLLIAVDRLLRRLHLQALRRAPQVLAGQVRRRQRGARVRDVSLDRYLTDPSLRAGVNYAFVSFYEDDCTTLDKDPDTWVKIFRKLSERFPNAKVGFGEFAPQCHMCAKTRLCPQCLGQQPEYIRRYYQTWHSRIRSQVPNYTGGFFYWYYWQDMVPKSKPHRRPSRTRFVTD
jgi:hypothetical protein